MVMTHTQAEVKVKGHSVQELEWKQADRWMGEIALLPVLIQSVNSTQARLTVGQLTQYHKAEAEKCKSGTLQVTKRVILVSRSSVVIDM